MLPNIFTLYLRIFTEHMPEYIQNGSKGDWVKYCQNLLNSRLFDPKSLWVDGDFGMKTELAVRRFQAMKFLKVDGKVGDKTWAALEAGPPPIKKRPPSLVVETHGGGV